jgi:hypothetical protein
MSLKEIKGKIKQLKEPCKTDAKEEIRKNIIPMLKIGCETYSLQEEVNLLLIKIEEIPWGG